jgi:hypothetical protein
MNILSDEEEAEIISSITSGISISSDFKLCTAIRYMNHVSPVGKSEVEIATEALGDDGVDNMILVGYLVSTLLEYGLLETINNEQGQPNSFIKKYSLSKKGKTHFAKGINDLISNFTVFIINPVMVGLLLLGFIDTGIFAASFLIINILTFIFVYQNAKTKINKFNSRKETS